MPKQRAEVYGRMYGNDSGIARKRMKIKHSYFGDTTWDAITMVPRPAQ